MNNKVFNAITSYFIILFICLGFLFAFLHIVLKERFNNLTILIKKNSCQCNQSISLIKPNLIDPYLEQLDKKIEDVRAFNDTKTYTYKVSEKSKQEEMLDRWKKRHGCN